MHTRPRPRPTHTITITASGISPAKVETESGDAIVFERSGNDAPTSVTVASRRKETADTALFGGDGNSYAIPSTQTVQVLEGFGNILFTISAGGSSAYIVIPRGMGGVMRETNDSTK